MSRGIVLLASLTALLQTWPARAELALHDGDRVMFFSTAPLWPSSFAMRAESFLQIKYPALKLRFWHWSPPAKASLDRANARLDDHLKAFQPTVVVFNFGLLHGESQPFDPNRLEAFRTGLLDMIARCAKAGARVILVTPNCPEIQQKTQLTRSRYDEVVGLYAEAVRAIAKDQGLILADWYATTADYIAANGSGAAPLLTIDGLSPTEAGAALGAECFLKAIGAESLEVKAEVDWGNLDARVSVGSISATRQDDATVRLDLHGVPIPWSVSGRGRAVEGPRSGSTWSRLTLKLTNAPPGDVLIGEVGQPTPGRQRYPSDAEIDLDTLAAVAQAEPVRELLECLKRKNRALDRYERFVEKPLDEPEYAEATGKYLDAMLAEVEAAARVIDRTPRTMDLSLEVRLAHPPAP